MITVLRMLSEKNRCGQFELPLLVAVDGTSCRRKSICLAVADLNEHQAIPVLHHQVDLAHTAAKVPGDQIQPAGREVLEGQLFRTPTYSNACGPRHPAGPSKAGIGTKLIEQGFKLVYLRKWFKPAAFKPGPGHAPVNPPVFLEI